MDPARIAVDVGLTSSVTLARDRSLPVDEAFAALVPGLVRGRVVGCTGTAATSVALALAARATAAGAWLAVVGMPTLGVEAARELGVAVDRLVSVDATGCRPGEWADRVAAAVDGFELVLTRPPGQAERMIRKVRQRVKARGAVLLTVGDPGGADVVLEAVSGEWQGLGHGHGHLRRRRVVVRAGGRRFPRPVECQLWLPGITGRAELVDADGPADSAVEWPAAEWPAVEWPAVEWPAVEEWAG
jgi:hypothetical protein